MLINTQETYRTPNRLEQKIKSFFHIITKILNVQNKERILTAAREKGQITYKGRQIRMRPDFSMKTIQKGLDRYPINSKRSQIPA